MSQKQILIAKVLPILANTSHNHHNNKLIQIKIKNMADFMDINDNCSDSGDSQTSGSVSGDKPKRKRERLDHMSIEDKIKRRKLHNRAAAQLARDRKKCKMNELNDTVNRMNKQKRLLEVSNEALITRCKALERENAELKIRLSSMSSAQSVVGCEGSDGIVESAELINVSQPQKHETIATQTTARPAPHSTTPLIYWLAVLNLIQCLNSSKNALKTCSAPTEISVSQLSQTQQMPELAQPSSQSPDSQLNATLTLLNT